MSTTQVQSVVRAFQILNVFDHRRAILSSTEIAERLGINHKTVHRFLLTLEAVGAVSRIGRGRFCLGIALADLGSQVAIHRVLSEAVQPHLEQLAGIYNEAIQAAVLEGSEVVSIAHIPSTHSLTIGIRVGKRWPAYCTAVGKVLLADMEDSTLRDFANTLKLERRTSNTISNTSGFIRHIKQVREQGYAANDQESELGMRGIAVPVKNRQGLTIAAISVSGPTTRLSMKVLLEIKDDLQACGERITHSLYGDERE